MADTATIRVKADTREAEQALGNLQKTLGALVTVGAAKVLADIADASTNLRNRLNTLEGAQSDVNGTFNSLVRIANSARTPLADTGQLYVTIARAAGDLGVNNQEALRYTELISKSLALSGTSASAASGALTQLGQALGQNAVRGDELNSILEGMPTIAQALADRFGVVVGALKLLGSQGKITGKDLLDAVAGAANKIETDFANAQVTVQSSLNVLSNSFTNFIGELDRATGGSGTAANAILRIAQSIDTLGKSLETVKNVLEIGLIIAVAALGARFAAAIAPIILGIRAMGAAGGSLATTIAKTGQSFSAWWRQTPRFADLGGRIASLGKLFSELGDRAKYVAPLLGTIGGTLAGVGAAIATYWERIVNRVKEYLGLTSGVKVNEGEIQALLEQQAVINQAIADSKDKTVKKSAEQVKIEGLIGKANEDRASALRGIMRDAEQAVVLAGLEGQERENVAALYRLENALVKEVRDENGKIVGYTQAVSAAELQRLTALERQRLSLERQRQLYDEINQAGRSVITESAAATDPRIRVEQRYIEDKIKLENYFIQNSLMTETQYQETLDRLTRQYTVDRMAAEMQLTRQQYDQKFQLDNQALIKSTEVFNIKLNQLKQLADLEFTNWNAELIRQNELFTQQQQHVARRMEMEFNIANQQMILATQVYDLQVQQQERLMAMKQSQFQQELQMQGFSLENAKKMAQERANFDKKTEMEKAQFGIEQAATVFGELGKRNKQAFEAAKAFNIANAVMNTYMGATKALATYPPPFNFIAAAAVVASGLAQVASIRAQTYSGRALGGPMVGGQQYIVGERGPELVTAPSGGARVTPNNELGGVTNINFTIQATDPRGFDALLTERKPMIINMIRQAQNDRGRRATV